jgi:RNA polymerase sigma-70 factor (ECF subfamily)
MPITVPLEAIERYRRAIRLKIWYHLGSFCADAEDLVQETLTRFVAALSQDALRNPDRPGAFLNGICNNVILEYRRGARRERVYSADLPEAVQAVAPALEWLEARDAIDVVLPLLSDRDRAVLRGFYLEEKSKEELCHETGISDANLRVILFRAKERFRKIYRERVKPRAASGH